MRTFSAVLALLFITVSACQCGELPVAAGDDGGSGPRRVEDDFGEPVFTFLPGEAKAKRDAGPLDAGNDAGLDAGDLDAGSDAGADSAVCVSDEEGDDESDEDSDSDSDSDGVSPEPEDDDEECESESDCEVEPEDDEDGDSEGDEDAKQVRFCLCHKGKKDLCLPEQAIEGHLNHGDELGECE
jgi:hypothetical protein